MRVKTLFLLLLLFAFNTSINAQNLYQSMSSVEHGYSVNGQFRMASEEMQKMLISQLDNLKASWN